MAGLPFNEVQHGFSTAATADRIKWGSPPRLVDAYLERANTQARLAQVQTGQQQGLRSTVFRGLRFTTARS